MSAELPSVKAGVCIQETIFHTDTDNLQHASHNAAMVETWLRAMPNERMTLFCSKDHYARLACRFSRGREKEDILKSLPVIRNKNGSKLWWVIKHLNEALLILFVLIKARFAKPKIVYFSFLSPIGQYWASLLIRCLRFRHRQVYITLHGLDILKGNNPKVIDRLYAYSLKKAFAMASKKKRYLVLETRASKYLMESGYLAASEMIELPHPYHFPEMETRSYAYPLTFVFLGVARLSKNAHLFFQLADLFSSEIRSGRVKFKLVGQILPELYPYLNEWVEYKPQAVMLDEEDYRRQCLTAHYAVFLYPEESYALTSSGAVMDAIAYNLPILALKAPLFDDLFSLADSPVGESFETIAHLASGIKELCNRFEPEMYAHLCHSFVALRLHYGIEEVSKHLKNRLQQSEEI